MDCIRFGLPAGATDTMDGTETDAEMDSSHSLP